MRLDERQLTTALGVSRTPIREALSLLEQEGFIRTVPRRGIYIIRKSKREMIEMIQMWAALESMAARLATLNASDAEIAKLRHLFDEFQNSPPSEHLGEYSDANIAFHTAVIALGGSQMIIDATRNLLMHVRAIRRATITQSDRAARSIIDHLKIIEALEKRDTELAERLTRQHTLDLAAHVDRLLRFSRLAQPHLSKQSAASRRRRASAPQVSPRSAQIFRQRAAQVAVERAPPPQSRRATCPGRAAPLARPLRRSRTGAPLSIRQIDPPAGLLGKVDAAKSLDAALQEIRVVLGRQRGPVRVQESRGAAASTSMRA